MLAVSVEKTFTPEKGGVLSRVSPYPAVLSGCLRQYSSHISSSSVGFVWSPESRVKGVRICRVITHCTGARWRARGVSQGWSSPGMPVRTAFSWFMSIPRYARHSLVFFIVPDLLPATLSSTSSRAQKRPSCVCASICCAARVRWLLIELWTYAPSVTWAKFSVARLVFISSFPTLFWECSDSNSTLEKKKMKKKWSSAEQASSVALYNKFEKPTANEIRGSCDCSIVFSLMGKVAWVRENRYYLLPPSGLLLFPNAWIGKKASEK